jgi:hypothetical protein
MNPYQKPCMCRNTRNYWMHCMLNKYIATVIKYVVIHYIYYIAIVHYYVVILATMHIVIHHIHILPLHSDPSYTHIIIGFFFT